MVETLPVSVMLRGYHIRNRKQLLFVTANAMLEVPVFVDSRTADFAGVYWYGFLRIIPRIYFCLLFASHAQPQRER
jgi:hypothetical protein